MPIEPPPVREAQPELPEGWGDVPNRFAGIPGTNAPITDEYGNPAGGWAMQGGSYPELDPWDPHAGQVERVRPFPDPGGIAMSNPNVSSAKRSDTTAQLGPESAIMDAIKFIVNMMPPNVAARRSATVDKAGRAPSLDPYTDSGLRGGSFFVNPNAVYPPPGINPSSGMSRSGGSFDFPTRGQEDSIVDGWQAGYARHQAEAADLVPTRLGGQQFARRPQPQTASRTYPPQILDPLAPLPVNVPGTIGQFAGLNPDPRMIQDAIRRVSRGNNVML